MNFITREKIDHRLKRFFTIIFNDIWRFHRGKVRKNYPCNGSPVYQFMREKPSYRWDFSYVLQERISGKPSSLGDEK
jgi:hypothetical protein